MEKIETYNVAQFADEPEQKKFAASLFDLSHPRFLERLARSPRVVAWTTPSATMLRDNTYYMSPGAADLLRENGLQFRVVGEVPAEDLPRKRVLCIGDARDWEDTGPATSLSYIAQQTRTQTTRRVGPKPQTRWYSFT